MSLPASRKYFSRFTKTSEVFASESQENLGEMIPRYDMESAIYRLLVIELHTSVLPVTKGLISYRWELCIIRFGI